MTIRMQESEAAADFSRFLAHLKAGDEVQLVAGSEAVGVIRVDRPSTARSGHIDQILLTLHQLEEQHGPLVVDDAYIEQMRKAHDDFNQPWEPEHSWD